MTKVACQLILALGLITLANPAKAADGELVHSARMMDYEESHYSAFTRVLVTGGASVMNGDASGPGFNGAVSTDFGRGWLTGGIGAAYLSMPALVGGSSSVVPSPANRVAVTAQYFGIPLVARFNYIERKDAAFTLKIGAMPAFMSNSGNSVADGSGNPGSTMTLNSNNVFALAGFTGSTPISKSMAFVIDGTYLYGTSDIDGFGSHVQSMLLSLGLSISI